MLLAKNKQVGRGNYYNHSGFADPLITGLLGLKPQPDDKLILHPLLPTGTWQYFALDGVPPTTATFSPSSTTRPASATTAGPASSSSLTARS